MSFFKGPLHILCLLLIFVIVFAQSEEGTLKQVIFLAKEGDRSPLKPLQVDEAFWESKTGGRGELTSKGQRQMGRLGEQYRQQYLNTHKFLPLTDLYRSVYFRSTDQDRALVSAQAFLYGLYGNDTGSKIPIFSVAEGVDYLLRSGEFCQKYQRRLYDETFKDNFRAKEEKAEPVLEFLQDFLGIELNLTSVGEIYDALACDFSNGRPVLPVATWTGVGGEALPLSKLEELRELAEWLFSVAFQPEFGKQTGGVFLSKLLQLEKDCVAAINDKPTSSCPVQFVGFFGHDSSIGAVLSALGVPVDKLPPYASQIVFELWHIPTSNRSSNISSDSEDTFFVKVFYNYDETKLWTHQIQLGCSSGGISYCGFSEFTKRYQEKAVEDPERECVIDYAREILAYTIVAIYSLLLLLTLVGVVLTLRSDSSHSAENTNSKYYQQDDEEDL